MEVSASDGAVNPPLERALSPSTMKAPRQVVEYKPCIQKKNLEDVNPLFLVLGDKLLY